MGDFRKSNGFGKDRRSGGFRPHGGGRPSFGGGRGGFGGSRGRDGGRPHGQMHSARCSECGNTCEVPFRPTGERPVYCNDCFGGKKDGASVTMRPVQKAAPVVSTATIVAAEDARINDLNHQVGALHKKVDSLLEMMRKMNAPVAAAVESAVVATETSAPAPSKTKAAPAKKVVKAPVKAAAKKSVAAKKPVAKAAVSKTKSVKK